MLTDELSRLLENAFTEAGYDRKYAQIVKSQRADLCQFQCNGAMAAAKEYKKAPFMISDDVIRVITSYEDTKKIVKKIETVKPGFMNITLTDDYIAHYINNLTTDPRLGCEKAQNPFKVVMDYGGPNIAKPLHVGHLRTAIIGESIKRLLKFLGHEVIADVHLGDWGLQMGMVILEYKRTNPDSLYFDDNFKGEYPTESPFTLAELEEIYPRVSKLCKSDETLMAEAKALTYKLQTGNKGCLALWKHMVNVSVADVKKNYEKLGVSFDFWYGESDGSHYVDPVVSILKEKNAVYESEGALVVDVAEEDDDVTIPPMLLYKSDGSILYSTTDLATIYQRIQDFDPDTILYVVDNRQGTHFKQVFRCATKHNIVSDKVSLEHIGFGTMNGKDGKPFKTRDGGIIRLSDLIQMVEDHARKKIQVKEDIDVDTVAKQVGLATLKFADLSNYRTKDYVFDLDKFSSFEGKTGPYLLYSYVRINNIIKKLKENNVTESKIIHPASEAERNIWLKICELPLALNNAAADRAPNIICEYIYDLSTLINAFYHKHHILNEENEAQKKSWMALLILTRSIMLKCLDILGIEAPEKM